MIIKFILSKSLYNCELKITDANQTQTHTLLTPIEETDTPYVLEIDVSGEFDFTVTPTMIDKNKILDEFDQETWTDRLGKKAASALISTLDNLILIVGCKYHVSGASDGDVIELSQQAYSKVTAEDFALLEIMPVMYSFFEASIKGKRLEPAGAFGTNRKKVLKSARALSLLHLGTGFILIYPIQVGRAKRLTKDKKVFKTLLRFHRMPEEKRERFIN